MEIFKKTFIASALTGLMAFGSASSAEEKPIKVGVVVFMSGAAAGPFGVPAKNAAELVIEGFNAGTLPEPYNTKGLGGAPVEIVWLDENGGTAKQVSEYRNLIQQQGVDVVVGYVSSGNCLAIAPVADELKKLTLFFDCGTTRVFEEGSYDYVFRPVGHATMDNVAAAKYVADVKPDVKTIAGINQNYAWGQDSWQDFEAALRAVKPDIDVKTSQMPKIGAGQYNAEISALMASRADVVHTSFWGGDLEGFIVQGVPRGLFKNSSVVLTTGESSAHRKNNQIPTGTIIGARGQHGAFAPESELNTWLRTTYEAKFDGASPSYPAYKMTQTLLGLKAAFDKAYAENGDKKPSPEQVATAFKHLEFQTPSGKIAMSLGNGHQAVQSIAMGTAVNTDGDITFENIKVYEASEVNPPEGVKSLDWIKSGYKAK